ncbi:hypothetical protein SmJEL517_g04773 [Synchytrium microbalum]|uniref:C2H2-type domain-containing protein n=1 Tax=Synchytrium microbalum TaxID=1806994 RepID=A0A507BX86_9FUNG|nr:uncharacterized protein SmJEL517_g04773 [Synchytrium microbalum]TPX32042.1 hypothetical protein SmJEL517_g04773 [Synchytrium microbalum]
MGQPQRRHKVHHSVRDVKRAGRTRARTKDLDQIFDDLKTPKVLTQQAPDAELPGLGQHYCLHCARYFVTQTVMDLHLKTKLHKKRVKTLLVQPYTLKESEEAAGLKTDNGTRSHVAVMEL